MRIDSQKLLFVGPTTARERFYEFAQGLGIIDFAAKSAPNSQRAEISSASPQDLALDLVRALKILTAVPTPQPTRTTGIRGDSREAHETAREILALDRERGELQERIASERRLRLIAEPFGAFSSRQLDEVAKRSERQVRFVACSIHRLPPEIPGALIEIASQGGKWYAIGLIGKHSAILPPFYEVGLTNSVSEIDETLRVLRARQREIEGRLSVLADQVYALQHALARALDTRDRQTALYASELILDENLFAAQGWIAASDLERLQSALQPLEFFAVPIAAAEGETAPTCLQNRGYSRIGQDLMQIYDAPATTDSDPSPWIFWSFALFFAIILGDGGYGALLLVGAVWASGKWARTASPAVRRALRLSRVLGIATVVWGGISATYFALSLAPDNHLRAISPLTRLAEKKAEFHFIARDAVFAEWTQRIPELKSSSSGREILQRAVVTEGGQPTYPLMDNLLDQIAMELALLIGVVHIAISLLRYARRNWPSAGWLIFLVGAFLSIPQMFQAPTFPQYLLQLPLADCAYWGKMLVWSGGGLALLGAVAQRGILGTLEAMTLIQIGADVLSYLRLYALGLSGAILCKTVNQGAGAVGGVSALIILVIGHSVNLGLGLMGGVIHGLRLNFLEWYHYSFDGGGRLHNPLAHRDAGNG